MPYTSEKPIQNPSSEELRARIPGWGVDLDPENRPGIPLENFIGEKTGAHWDFPERQPERWPRERSVEHMMLPPVFGTSCPPKGISGAIRKFAYGKFSEGTNIHWLLLMGADRVDVIENRLMALVSGRPDNPITESGVMSEFKRGGVRSRLGRGRSDVKHHAMDPLIQMVALAAVAGLAFGITRAVRERRGGR